MFDFVKKVGIFKRMGYRIYKFYLSVRYKLILWFIRDMPVITNCTIYDDVMEFNFGKTRTYKPCIAFNNKVKSFVKAARKYVQSEEVNDDGIERIRNSFVLKI